MTPTFRNIKNGAVTDMSLAEMIIALKLTETHVHRLVEGKSSHGWVMNRDHIGASVTQAKAQRKGERKAKNDTGASRDNR